MQKLSYSLEDYIEEIFIEISKNGQAKVTEIAKSLDVKKASVTGALNTLAKKELINYKPYNPITLTKQGEIIAQKIFEKHELIAEFFVKTLNVKEQEALNTACAMEHIISEEFFEKIKKFLNKSNENTEIK